MRTLNEVNEALYLRPLDVALESISSRVNRCPHRPVAPPPALLNPREESRKVGEETRRRRRRREGEGGRGGSTQPVEVVVGGGSWGGGGLHREVEEVGAIIFCNSGAKPALGVQ